MGIGAGASGAGAGFFGAVQLDRGPARSEANGAAAGGVGIKADMAGRRAWVHVLRRDLGRTSHAGRRGADTIYLASQPRAASGVRPAHARSASPDATDDAVQHPGEP